MQILEQAEKSVTKNISSLSSVSIIVPTFRRSGTLKETLTVLSKLDYPPQSYEVIVVDDGSNDDTRQVVESFQSKLPNFIYHYQENGGAAKARNTGAGIASYDLLLFIDDDILLTDDSLERIIEFHKTNKDSLLSGTWVYSSKVLEHLKQTPFGRFKIHNDYTCMGGIEKNRLSDNVYECESLASFCLSMTKETFHRIGGFNENFPYAGCEDQEFSMRASSLHLKLYYLTDILTFHNELDRVDKEKWLNRQYTGVQGFPLLCELYPERKRSELFRENYRITAQDDLRLKIKKVIKKATFGKSGFYILKTLTDLMEKVPMPEPILNKCYSVMAGMMIYQGFQVGRNNLQNLESPNIQDFKGEVN